MIMLCRAEILIPPFTFSYSEEFVLYLRQCHFCRMSKGLVIVVRYIIDGTDRDLMIDSADARTSLHNTVFVSIMSSG